MTDSTELPQGCVSGVGLYNGTSNRARGWKSRRFGDLFLDGRIPAHSNVKRWDGAARMAYDWDNLRRDPELWYKHGNCFVHLYGKGQSRRGPAFKVPVSALIAAKCEPLLEKFMVPDLLESPGSGLDGERSFNHFWSRVESLDRVDLYIPPPPASDRNQALQYHLATRNFFAWIFRRSMVAEHLGTALVTLLNTMAEFRSAEENMEDLLSYLDEEGYLDVRNSPDHALAVLHLAESLRMKDLYISAFAHCVGMSDKLFLSTEYQYISSVSRKLIRRAKTEMDLKLAHAGSMLKNFLDDDLSEANLGLSGGARAHLERFRAYLHGFYTSKLGYFPPPSVDPRCTIFQGHVYRSMREDFEALYEYLVDKSFTTAHNSPFLAQGGLCTMQSVHAFDLRHKYKSLPNPLPLLPEQLPSKHARRVSVSWLNKSDKLRPDQRLLAHTALLKASNKSNPDLLRNDLVIAYRRFEEDSIFHPLKADRSEKISQVDARKVRWILIYDLYQTLRHCTQVPSEVRDQDVLYSLAISTANLPRWKDELPDKSLGCSSSDEETTRGRSASPLPGSVAFNQSTPGLAMDIKPDIDYFALTHRQTHSSTAARDFSFGPPVVPPRSRSLSRSFAKNSSFRRSLSILRGQPTRESMVIQPQPKRASYHEIVVHGYGNGTNDVNMTPTKIDAVLEEPTSPRAMTSRSASTSSNASSVSKSDNSEADTSISSIDAAETPQTEYSSSDCSSRRCSFNNATACNQQGDKAEAKDVSDLPSPQAVAPPQKALRTMYSNDDMLLVTPPLPRRSSKRFSVYTSQATAFDDLDMQPSPLRICKKPSTYKMADDSDEWSKIAEDLEADYKELANSMDDIKPEWEQFADLGGLQPINNAS